MAHKPVPGYEHLRAVDALRNTADPIARKWLWRAWKAYCCTIVSNAVKAGRLERKPCERCGAVKVQAHHGDYAKPLDVTWLCRKHHRELEKDAGISGRKGRRLECALN